jgi:hypothetical protein
VVREISYPGLSAESLFWARRQLGEKGAQASQQHPWREPPGMPRRDSSRGKAPTLGVWATANRLAHRRIPAFQRERIFDFFH